jgi:hypothetical protein
MMAGSLISKEPSEGIGSRLGEKNSKDCTGCIVVEFFGGERDQTGEPCIVSIICIMTYLKRMICIVGSQ